MPALILTVLRLFGTGLGYQLLTGLGLGLFTGAALNTLLSTMISQATSSWGGVPAAALGILGLAGVDKGLSILFGALTTRVFIKSMAVKLGASTGSSS